MFNESTARAESDVGRLVIIPARIEEESDIVAVRNIVKSAAARLNFSLIEATKLVTAVSELARNTLTHGGGGFVTIDEWAVGDRFGLRIVFEDHGPGIPDIEQAMQEGFTSWNGMGVGLPGSKKLMDEFEIESTVGKGTRVAIVKWR